MVLCNLMRVRNMCLAVRIMCLRRDLEDEHSSANGAPPHPPQVKAMGKQWGMKSKAKQHTGLQGVKTLLPKRPLGPWVILYYHLHYVWLHSAISLCASILPSPFCGPPFCHINSVWLHSAISLCASILPSPFLCASILPSQFCVAKRSRGLPGCVRLENMLKSIREHIRLLKGFDLSTVVVYKIVWCPVAWGGQQIPTHGCRVADLFTESFFVKMVT